MKFKHINLLIFLVIAAFLFTFVTYLVLNSTNLLIGSVFIFVLLLAIMSFLLKRMIEHMYDLLVSPPVSGKIIDPFQITAFGRVFWQYPRKGSFTFMDAEADQVSVVEPPLQDTGKNHAEVKASALLIPRNKPGTKFSYSEEKQFEIAKEYLDSQKPDGTRETYDSMADKYHISKGTFKNYLTRYREAVNTGKILE